MANSLVLALNSVTILAAFLSACETEPCEQLSVRPGIAIGAARIGAPTGDVETWLGPPRLRRSLSDAPKDAFSGPISDTQAAATEMLLFNERCFTMFVSARRDTVVTIQIAGVRDPTTVTISNLGTIHVGRFHTEAQFTPLSDPTTRTRHRDTEAQMKRERAVEGEVEYYSYVFDSLGLVVGAVFDHARRDAGEPWIGVRSVSVVQRRR